MIRKIFILLSFLTHSQAETFSEMFELSSDSWAYHDKMPTLAIAATAAAGLIIGNDTRFGNTVWKSIDSMIIAGVITQAGKYTFNRVRPYESHLYDKQWFQRGHDSFPSGHTSSMTSVVAPFIFEYAKEEPLVHLLWALPAQQMIGRVKDKKHYVSDVLAGFAVGVFSGWLATQRDMPFTLSWREGGVYAGLNFNF